MALDKIGRLSKVKKIAQSCYNCELGKTRNKLVFGEGAIDALLMIIGEAPGKNEDELGRPFVGRSGQLLRKMLLAIGLDPMKDVFINNIVMCRPPNNREPQKEERNECINFLWKRIEIIRPKILLLLGKTAVRGICPNFEKDSIDKLRSITKRLGMITYKDIPVIVTYHPSALLRTPWRRRGAQEDFIFLQKVYKELE